MAHRNTEMEPSEFLEWILEVRRAQMQSASVEPVTTVVTGCAGFVIPGRWRPREPRLDLEARLARWTC